MASLSEVERDLLRDRILSGIAAAKDRGKTFGRKADERPKSDHLDSKVLALIEVVRSFGLSPENSI